MKVQTVLQKLHLARTPSAGPANKKEKRSKKRRVANTAIAAVVTVGALGAATTGAGEIMSHQPQPVPMHPDDFLPRIDPANAPGVGSLLGQWVTEDLPLYSKDLFGAALDKLPFVGEEHAPFITQVDPAQLEHDVRTLTDFAARSTAHPEVLDQVSAYLSSEFEKAGGRVTEQPFTFDYAQLKSLGFTFSPEEDATLQSVDGRTYRNVIASFGPEDGDRLIVGAHYDSAHDLPGADDNASGVAGLMELARQLGQQAPGKRVDLVAYANEERPLGMTPFMGSAVHSASLREQGVEGRMIALEMIGYYSDEHGSQEMPDVPGASLLGQLYGDQGNFIGVIGRSGGAELVRDVNAAINQANTGIESRMLVGPGLMRDIHRSDHFTYAINGFPSAMISDTANMRNKEYHGNDTPDRLDYVRMSQTMVGVINFVYSDRTA